MKKLFLLTVCFLVTTLLMAAPVTVEQARQKAAEFLSAKGGSRRAPAQIVAQQTVLNAVDAKGQPYLYAFNVGSDNGFVLVSGSDVSDAIIGYAEIGSFDEKNMPDNMRSWLTAYIDALKRMEQSGMSKGMMSVSAGHRALKNSISPLLHSTWNQDEPYNNNCPTKTNQNVTEHTVTGCVATAMAQIMYYHKCPSSTFTTPTIPGYTMQGSVDVYGSNMPALSPTSFNWNAMYDSYDNGEDGTEVAKLMQYCGTAVQMEYNVSSNGGSSSNNVLALNALVDYFGYDADSEYALRSDYSYLEWIDLIYQELAANRPVLFAGQATIGGHSFVVDGYDEDDFFHVNWGWGGKSDGYFRVSMMDPKDQGIGGTSTNEAFNMGQGICLGIRPDTGVTPVTEGAALTIGSIYLYVDSSHPTESESSSPRYGNGYLIQPYITVYNLTGFTKIFDYGLRVVKDDGTFQKDYIWNTGKSVNNNSGFSTARGFLLDPSTDPGITDGTYKVYVICKESSSEDWLLCEDSEYYYLTLTIGGNQLNATAVNSTVELQLNSIQFSGESAIVDTPYYITLNVTNNGTKAYHGDIVMRLTGYSNKLAGLNCDINPGQTKDLVLTYTPSQAGTVDVTIKADAVNQVLYEGSITAVKATSAPVNVSKTAATLNNVGKKVYGNTVKMHFSLTNNSMTDAYENGVKAVLYRVTGRDGQYIYFVGEQTKSNSETIATGATKEYDFTFNGLIYGEEYLIRYGYFNASGTFVYSATNYFTIEHGIIAINAEGDIEAQAPTATYSVPTDACAVDLRGLSTLPTITKNNNNNCLFFLDEGKSLDGITDNVVIGGVASNIVLEDNAFGFYTFDDFTAQNISYTRTETNYLDKNTQKGWTTLVLPFAADGCKTILNNNDYELTWFQSASEMNKNFWLMDFDDEHDGIVEFGYAGAQLEANKPYIMALPGDSYGNKWSLTDLPIIFYATDAEIKANVKASTTGTNFKFVGTIVQKSNLENIYKLNADGNRFVKGTASIEPFRAYFAPTTIAATATELSIGFGGTTTGVIEIDAVSGVDKVNDNGIYNMNGQRVSHPTKGLYIVNGKKVVIK